MNSKIMCEFHGSKFTKNGRCPNCPQKEIPPIDYFNSIGSTVDAVKDLIDEASGYFAMRHKTSISMAKSIIIKEVIDSLNK